MPSVQQARGDGLISSLNPDILTLVAAFCQARDILALQQSCRALVEPLRTKRIWRRLLSVDFSAVPSAVGFGLFYEHPLESYKRRRVKVQRILSQAKEYDSRIAAEHRVRF
jgi:hypothetical protein